MMVLFWVEFYSLSSSHRLVGIRFCSPGGFCSIPTLILKDLPHQPPLADQRKLLRSVSTDSFFFLFFLISLMHSCGYDLINLFVSGILLSLISVMEFQSY